MLKPSAPRGWGSSQVMSLETRKRPESPQRDKRGHKLGMGNKQRREIFQAEPSWSSSRLPQEMAAPLNRGPALEVCPSPSIMRPDVNVAAKIYGQDASPVSSLRL